MNFSHRSALVQVLIVSVTCFCCPGLFNALSSFASGIDDPALAYNGNSVIYALFACSGIFAGGFVNRVGPKITLFIGTWGYVLYAISLFYIQAEKQLVDGGKTVYSAGGEAFYYIACATLGICAGLLWTAQGQICMAYPTSETKGTYFSIFWVIFNLGATLGGLISFGVNYDLEANGGATSDVTYIVFIVLMGIGSFMSLLLVKPDTVVRNDGTKVVVTSLPDWKAEASAVLGLFTEKKMLLLLPLFAYSNWFYTYHSFYNVSLFNVRTSGFSSAFYWGSQMLGSYIIGKFLDNPNQTIKKRAILSVYIITVLTFSMWAIGVWAQVDYDMQYGAKKNIDFQESAAYAPKILLYIFYGFNDSICQVWSYWLMGQMSDDMATLGRYAGYYKAIQSASGAISWKIGGEEVDPMVQLIINWVLAFAGIIGAYFTIQNYLPDSLPSKEAEFEQENFKEMASPSEQFNKLSNSSNP